MNPAVDASVSKVQKKIETLSTKNSKLQAENVALKEKLKHVKSVTSRVRKIPKKPADAE